MYTYKQQFLFRTLLKVFIKHSEAKIVFLMVLETLDIHVYCPMYKIRDIRK